MNIIDLHCDTILGLMEDKKTYELRQNNLCIDIDKLSKANSLAQFFALFVDMKEHENPFEYCMEMADKFFIEIEKNSDRIRFAANYEEIMKNQAQGKMSAVLAVEEGGVLRGKIHNLRILHKLGVRLLTLTWNYPNEIGFPNKDEEFRGKGLTTFGQEVVYEMNRLGMLIDVSHLSDGGFYDVARLSNKPFIASHSNARTITGHPRNLTDDMIKILADHGGVTGINYSISFLSEEDTCTLKHMADHIKHISNIGGIDVVALGSDFDGTRQIEEIANISENEKLIYELKKNSFSEDDIEKIFYKNALRVIKDVL